MYLIEEKCDKCLMPSYESTCKLCYADELKFYNIKISKISENSDYELGTYKLQRSAKKVIATYKLNKIAAIPVFEDIPHDVFFNLTLTYFCDNCQNNPCQCTDISDHDEETPIQQDAFRGMRRRMI